MAEKVEQGVSTGMQFKLLMADSAFLKLWAFAQKMIDDAEKDYFKMPDVTAEESAKCREQKLMIKHYEQFKGALDSKIKATIAQLQNNK